MSCTPVNPIPLETLPNSLYTAVRPKSPGKQMGLAACSEQQQIHAILDQEVE